MATRITLSPRYQSVSVNVNGVLKNVLVPINHDPPATSTVNLTTMGAAQYTNLSSVATPKQCAIGSSMIRGAKLLGNNVHVMLVPAKSDGNINVATSSLKSSSVAVTPGVPLVQTGRSLPRPVQLNVLQQPLVLGTQVQSSLLKTTATSATPTRKLHNSVAVTQGAPLVQTGSNSQRLVQLNVLQQTPGLGTHGKHGSLLKTTATSATPMSKQHTAKIVVKVANNNVQPLLLNLLPKTKQCHTSRAIGNGITPQRLNAVSLSSQDRYVLNVNVSKTASTCTAVTSTCTPAILSTQDFQAFKLPQRVPPCLELQMEPLKTIVPPASSTSASVCVRGPPQPIPPKQPCVISIGDQASQLRIDSVFSLQGHDGELAEEEDMVPFMEDDAVKKMKVIEIVPDDAYSARPAALGDDLRAGDGRDAVPQATEDKLPGDDQNRSPPGEMKTERDTAEDIHNSVVLLESHDKFTTSPQEETCQFLEPKEELFVSECSACSDVKPDIGNNEPLSVGADCTKCDTQAVAVNTNIRSQRYRGSRSGLKIPRYRKPRPVKPPLKNFKPEDRNFLKRFYGLRHSTVKLEMLYLREKISVIVSPRTIRQITTQPLWLRGKRPLKSSPRQSPMPQCKLTSPISQSAMHSPARSPGLQTVAKTSSPTAVVLTQSAMYSPTRSPGLQTVAKTSTPTAVVLTQSAMYSPTRSPGLQTVAKTSNPTAVVLTQSAMYSPTRSPGLQTVAKTSTPTAVVLTQSAYTSTSTSTTVSTTGLPTLTTTLSSLFKSIPIRQPPFKPLSSVPVPVPSTVTTIDSCTNMPVSRATSRAIQPAPSKMDKPKTVPQKITISPVTGDLNLKGLKNYFLLKTSTGSFLLPVSKAPTNPTSPAPGRVPYATVLSAVPSTTANTLSTGSTPSVCVVYPNVPASSATTAAKVTSAAKVVSSPAASGAPARVKPEPSGDIPAAPGRKRPAPHVMIDLSSSRVLGGAVTGTPPPEARAETGQDRIKRLKESLRKQNEDVEKMRREREDAKKRLALEHGNL